jgi:hypothetical protein
MIHQRPLPENYELKARMVKKHVKLLIKMIDLLNHFFCEEVSFIGETSMGSIGSAEWSQINRCMKIFN